MRLYFILIAILFSTISFLKTNTIHLANLTPTIKQTIQTIGKTKHLQAIGNKMYTTPL